MNRHVVRILFLFFVLSSSSRAQNWFDAPQILPFGIEVLNCHDVDGDGDQDLLAVTAGNSAFLYLYNDGQGSFTPGPQTSLLPDTIYHLDYFGFREFDDIDGDQVQDAVFVSSYSFTSGSVDVYFGAPDGTFSAPQSLVVASLAQLGSGDSDNDGRTELLVVTRNASQETRDVRWVEWEGGQFLESPLVSIPSNRRVSAVSAIDIHGDGRDELFIVGFATEGLIDDDVFVVELINGQLEITQTFSIPNAFAGSYLTAGDIDSDGDNDLLAFQAGSAYDGAIQPILNQGDGTVQLGPLSFIDDLSREFGLSGVELGDWDDDGDIDLISQTHRSLFTPLKMSILANDGAQGFTPAFSADAAFDGEPAGVVDLDADGHLDYVGTGTLIFGDGTFDPIMDEFTSSRPLLDWEGDGDIDAVGSDSVRINRGNGNFEPLSLDIPSAGGPDIIFGNAVGQGDYNGDGLGDQLRARLRIINDRPFETEFIEMVLLIDNGSGNFIEAQIATDDEEITAIGERFSFDIDGDGDVDLLTSERAWLNNGSGVFLQSQSVFPAGNLQDVGDIDNDSDIDVVVRYGSELTLQRNLGGLSFSAELLAVDVDFGDSATLLDLDQDTDLDVAAGRAEGANNGTYVIENMGGVLGAPIYLPAEPLQQGAKSYGAGDVDGDGQTDLLCALDAPFGQTSNFCVYRGLGPSLLFDSPRRWIGKGSVDFADLDGDGDIDVSGTLVRGRRFDGPNNGSIRQYGEGFPGSAEAIPVLGASGPMRVGSAASIRLRRALGGTIGLFVVGLSESDIADFPFPGAHSYAEPWLFFWVLPVGGIPGSPGRGEFTLNYVVDPLVANTAFYHQMILLDAGSPFGRTVTQGLEIIYGQ